MQWSASLTFTVAMVNSGVGNECDTLIAIVQEDVHNKSTCSSLCINT